MGLLLPQYARSSVISTCQVSAFALQPQTGQRSGESPHPNFAAAALATPSAADTHCIDGSILAVLQRLLLALIVVRLVLYTRYVPLLRISFRGRRG